jgi:hypothetical protein
VQSLNTLKRDLLFLDAGMMKARKPISMVSVINPPVAPVPIPAAELEESAVVSDNWAALHGSKKTIADMEDQNVDVSDLEMAAVFGRKK